METYIKCIVIGALTGAAIIQNSVATGNRPVYTAIVNISYKDPVSGENKTDGDEIGHYGSTSRLGKEEGLVVHIKGENGKHDGCSRTVNAPSVRWIALVARGECKFHEKISNAAIHSNASGVVIYDNQEVKELVYMDHKVDDVVSIFISNEDGMKIVNLLDNGTKVYMHISVGNQKDYTGHHINKTSVLFVSISFIVLMIISLAWLVFYYIQRFRYAHAKERLTKRLMHAARKAIGKMSSKSLKAGDKETDQEFDPCAVCIENYRSGDVVRTLPCGHVFHKCCIDPWLIEQRSCPMCKLDILKAYGLQIHNSMESLVNLDMEAPSTSIGPSELLPPTSVLRSDPGIIEVVYYPNNLHRFTHPVEFSHSEEEEEVTERPKATGVSERLCSEPKDSSETMHEEKQALLAQTDSPDGAINGGDMKDISECDRDEDLSVKCELSCDDDHCNPREAPVTGEPTCGGSSGHHSDAKSSNKTNGQNKGSSKACSGKDRSQITAVKGNEDTGIIVNSGDDHNERTVMDNTTETGSSLSSSDRKPSATLTFSLGEATLGESES